jgi:hypothetical protein
VTGQSCCHLFPFPATHFYFCLKGILDERFCLSQAKCLRFIWEVYVCNSFCSPVTYFLLINILIRTFLFLGKCIHTHTHTPHNTTHNRTQHTHHTQQHIYIHNTHTPYTHTQVNRPIQKPSLIAIWMISHVSYYRNMNIAVTWQCPW